MPTQDFDPEWDLPRPPLGFLGMAMWAGVIIVTGVIVAVFFF